MSTRKKPSRLIRLITPAVVVVGLFAVVLGAPLLAQPPAEPAVPKVTISTSASHQLVATPKVTKLTAKPAPATSPPATASTPVTVATPTPASPTSPVLTMPAPDSPVSSLTPTPAATPAPAPVTNPAPSQTVVTPPTPATYTSANWAGYVETSGNFTGVSGSWTAPQVTGNGVSTSADATWIGIGGVSINDLIQVGTQDQVSANGHVSTAAFYELLPAVSQPIATITVTPGDSLTAAITEVSSGQWTISITDGTSGQSWTSTVSYTSTHSSAEWIEEAPSTSRGRIIPLDNFGTVHFSAVGATDNGGSVDMVTGYAQPITLVNNQNQAQATPSAIGSNTASFSVARNTP